MTLWQRYLRPKTIQEALQALAEGHPEARPIAGGTDLLIDLQQGRESAPHTLVDVSGIDDMSQIDHDDQFIYLGAAVTHRRIVDSPLLSENAQAVVTACGLIGGPQVRNVATLGGNVAHALPAGDGTIGLLAAGAEAELADMDGRRWQPLQSLFTGPGQTSFDRSKTLLTRFRFPMLGAREGTAFTRVMRPQGIAIAILNLSVWLRLDEADRVESARLALGPSGPTPRRSPSAEAELSGAKLTDDTLAKVAKALLADARLRTSRHRATQSYRQHLVSVLVERAVPLAGQRAKGADPAAARFSQTDGRHVPHVQ